MRSSILFAITITLLLSIQTGGASADDSSTPTSADWRNQLAIAPDAAQQMQVYAIVARRPQSDNGFLVPWLHDNNSRLQPMFAFELSRRLFDFDRDAALYWFTVGRLRLVYDARRCADPTANDGFAFNIVAQRFAGKVATYVVEHGQEALAALRRVRAKSDLFEYDASPEWICGHGMAAYGEALGLQKPNPQGPLKPRDQWPAVRQTLIAELPKAEEAMVRSLAEADAATALAASRPHIVPSELAAAAHEDKLRAIGAEARSSFEAAHGASPNGLVSSPWWLLNLAEVEIEAGDKAGARDTLTAAQAIPGNNPAGLPGTTEGRLAMLWVRAGDSATAHRYAESISKPADRLSALGEYGAALAHAGDLAGANVAMETVARAPEPEDDSATRPAVGQIALATMPPRDLAIRKIGTALAEKHDMRGALRAASLLTEDRLHAGLLADIASKQCTDRDGGAFETLRLADEAVHGLKDPGHFGPVDTFVYALAACGDVARAADVARELAPKRTAMVLGQVAGLLMEHGDRDRSRQVDAVNVDALTDVYGLLNLAKREIARGDVELAKPHIAGASAMTLEAVRSKRVAGRPLHEILDALSPVASIADTQATVGAYADAIHTIEVEDPINRPQFFVSLVAAAVTRHDGNGVKESLRTVFNAARQANVEFPLNHLTHLVASLANAGYFAEARQILGLVPQSGRQSEMFAGAQAALGDIDGARTTLYALDLTDAQRTQSLVRIALGRHDLASALDALKGGAPDDALSSIASAQAKNGDLTAAMATAWQIRGLGLRAETLVALLKALKRS